MSAISTHWPEGRSFRLAAVLLVSALGGGCWAAETPREIPCAPCTQAPRIDGRLTPGEWDEATHLSLALSLVRGAQPAPERAAELWVMNSSANLYLAFRVPDAERQASFSPVKADLALLVFAKGDQVAPGDDRKIVIPGIYADKHVTGPGADADDARRDGRGAMGYRKAEAGGEYFIEFSLPLDSGDGEDLSAHPGDRVRFNLVYADGFAPDLSETEIGGLYSGGADDATGWGYLVLAADVGQERPAPELEWAERLFPHTGAPGEFENRLRRVETDEIPLADGRGGQVTCEFLYRGIDGRPLTGHARVFLPPVVLDEPGAIAPLVYSAGYELDAGSAAGWLSRGMVVATPHAEPDNPLVRGPNLDIALLHATRALPFVDSSRVLIQGGSAGGYMALMLTAESFPLIGSAPDVPPVNWGYNAAYFLRNRDLARATAEGTDRPALPVLTQVIPLAELSTETLGQNTDGDPWLLISPVSQLETITAPTQVVFSTADMLVPINQVSPDLAQPRAPGQFPDGFTTAVDSLLARVDARKTLLGVLPVDSYELLTVPVPVSADKLRLEDQTGVKSTPIDLPFSRTQQWSIVIIDEGPPEPDVGHFRYVLATSRQAWQEWVLSQALAPAQLTLPKLTRLMMRMQGEEYLPAEVQPAGAAAPFVASHLDFPEAERADVLRGLTAFARDDACALRLAELYSQLPEERKALGPSLGDGTAGAVRAALTGPLGPLPPG